MSRINLKDRLKEGLFLLDGAMGTELIARGIEPGTCNDFLNVESPDIVFDIHRGYFAQVAMRFSPIPSAPISTHWPGMV